ncbi:MAG: zinc ABC transporter substrate-binding protein [Muribaculaceae bacterium]|nr:zinc ABC transporter substrate-binding protein [Muribaculaceae bacterium]
MLKRLLNILSAAAIIICMTTCGKNRNESSKPMVAVSIAPLGNLVESICGDDYEIITLLDRGANPETFDPAMSKRAAAEKSDIYFMLDAFPFEKSVAGKRENVIDVSTGVQHLYGTHSHGDNEECHHEADPHIWTSGKNMKIIAHNIGEAMMKHYPENAGKYRIRLDSLITVIDSLDNALTLKLNNAHPKSFAIWHPSLGYFAKDYGLKQIAVGEESKEISPVRLKETINKAVADSVIVFFFQKEFDSRQAFSINEQLGAKMITIDPLAADWMGQLDMITDELTRQ